ncbi:MAG: DUF11 domain-containing protein, partial [Firmicutes bacterium]|nr:DUF11 domain-containing protein [Bacillota bacterium]
TGSDVTIGEVITYQIALTLPEGTLSGLTVVDRLPEGLAYVVGSAAVDTSAFNGTVPDPVITASGGDGDDVTLTFGEIVVTADNVPTNNRLIIRLRARVLDVPGNVGIPPQTVLTNGATAQATGGPVRDAGTVNVTVVEPQMSIRKVIEPSQAAAGDIVTFTLTVSNTGTSTAFDVIVEDELLNSEFVNASAVSTPAGFTFGLIFDGSKTTVRYTGGDIGVGQTVVFVFRAALASGVTPGATLNNTAVVSQATTLPGVDAYERDEPDVQASDSVTVIVPDLAISKTDGRTLVTPGEMLTYTVTITNQGGRAATGVVVTDTLPLHTTYVPGSASHDGVYDGGQVIWTIATLGAGESVTRTFRVTVDNPLPAGVTHLTNTVVVRDDGTHGSDPTPGNNTDEDVDGVEASPDLVVVKDDGETVVGAGQVLTYTVVVENVGDQGATGVVVTDTLP